MPFEKSDFILIDYVAKVKETGEVFDTTIENVAKKEKLYKEGETYEPKLVTVGEGWVLKALDESLANLELNKATTIEILPEKAFGNRDPEKVRLMPLRRLTAKGITPQLGMRIEIDGKINALIHRRIPVVDITNFTSKIGKTSIEINVPEEAFYVEGLQLAKRGITTDIQKFFPELATIKFVETFKKKEPAAVTKPTEPTEPAEQTEKTEQKEQI